MAKLKICVKICFTNLYRIRWLHYYMRGERQILRFEARNEKTLWCTSASQEKTLSFVGRRIKTTVKESVPTHAIVTH